VPRRLLMLRSRMLRWRLRRLRQRYVKSLLDRSVRTNFFFQSLQDVTSKKKKEKDDIIVSVEDLSPLAQPLAQKKMLKKLHKTIKKGVRNSFAELTLL
jgi:hypothetical protein